MLPYIGKYRLISINRYNELKGTLLMGRNCEVCSESNSMFIVIDTDGFNTFIITEVCSETCFNMWLMSKYG